MDAIPKLPIALVAKIVEAVICASVGEANVPILILLLGAAPPNVTTLTVKDERSIALLIVVGIGTEAIKVSAVVPVTEVTADEQYSINWFCLAFQVDALAILLSARVPAHVIA
jgi:hypothetical protein